MVDRTGGNIRIAVVGCGAVAEILHLPALRKLPGCEIVALVDRDEARAQRFANPLGVDRVFTDHRELLGSDLDGAIVTVPTHAHLQVSADLLRAGIPVLVEKPVARTLEECDQMIAAADEGGALLAVCHFRRMTYQCRLAKQAIAGGLLGTIHSFDLRDGYGFGWPVTTDFPFRKEAAGGGVLIDLGVHAIDVLGWWFGELEVVEHQDNDYGGVESESLTRFTNAAGIDGVAEFSRTRTLRNTVVVSGDRATMEVSLTSNKITFHLPGSSESLHGSAEPPGASQGASHQSPVELTVKLQKDWLEAIERGRPASVTGAEARRSLALILDCYANRRLLELPWIHHPHTEGVRL